MRAVLFLFILGGVDFSSGSSVPPSPVNVTFTSLNLKNVLEWLPGNETPDGTRYTVQFALYGDSVAGSKRVNWRPVPRCKETERTWCDLSRETWDAEQGYYGRVRAVGAGLSKWVVTQMRFIPKADTTFGQPQISVEVKDNNAIIYLSGPIRYQPDDHAPPISMAWLYPQMTYNLSVYNSRQGRVHHLPVTSSPYKYGPMDFETEYCFSAQARFLSLRFNCHRSERLCITTGKDPVIGQVQMAVVGIVCPSLCICIVLVVGYILYHYLMGNGQKRPHTLDVASLHLQPNASLLPDAITPLKSQCPLDDDDKDNNASDCVIYSAAQHPQPPPEPEEPCADSLSYGVVGVATTDAGGQCDAHPNELPVKDATYPASQCSLPQAGSRRPLENATQSQSDFPTMYLANTAPHGLRMPMTEGKELNGSPYRRRGEDAENYSVLTPTGALRDEEGGPLCVEWDREKRKLVLPGLEMTMSRGEGEGGGKKVAMGDLGLEKVFVRQASREEAAPSQGATTGWEVDDIVRKWDLVISMNE
ncbi:interleukin-20 receptor subunit alpha isoform X2 [Hippocampus zosterae]|nr:interleukin-20 receptor subunit alpha isoform X2 [Hippocampus zosterae]